MNCDVRMSGWCQCFLSTPAKGAQWHLLMLYYILAAFFGINLYVSERKEICENVVPHGPLVGRSNFGVPGSYTCVRQVRSFPPYSTPEQHFRQTFSPNKRSKIDAALCKSRRGSAAPRNRSEAKPGAITFHKNIKIS